MINYCCPIDGDELAISVKSLRCKAGHTYDQAREGYFNLLLVQQKASLNPGDNPEMVTARRNFLDGGHFLPIAEKLKDWVGESGCENLLDAGCGEGYYLNHLRNAYPSLALVGTDISKFAVRAAAKKYKNISWAVASNRQLPFAPGYLDVILCLFGFPIWDSFRKVQRSGSIVLMIDPSPDHLLELRQIIYPNVKESALVSLQAAFDAGYELKREETFTFPVQLESSNEIQNLLAMTPHGYRMSAEGRERVAKRDRLTTGASVVFRLLQLL